MTRLKAENFAIAVGLIFLYMVMPPLTYDIRQILAQPLVKRTDNSWLAKYDPETELLDGLAATQSQAAVPAYVEYPARPELPVEVLFRSKTFLPFLGSSNEQVELAQAPAEATAPTGAAPVEAAPVETAAPAEPEPPIRIVIPAIGLDAPVIPAKTRVMNSAGQKYRQWMVPNQFAAGWHKNTARLGEPGNTVINGHHNVYGEVFRGLVKLEEGGLIQIYSATKMYEYIVANKMILPEPYQELDMRMENARWILPSDDERITLITCWPYESNTHRLIIVARPVL